MESPPAAAVAPSVWVRARDWLVDWRVVLSTLLFIGLVIEDALRGRKPHSWLSGEAAGTVGVVLVVLGVTVRSWSAGVLRKGKELAVGGPYSLCRHPLYFGSALMMFGFCLLIGDWWNWLYVCGPVAALYWLTIGKEEERIATQYAEPWPAYAARVPRLLPWRPDLYVHSAWSVQQWLGNREYQAVAGSTAGLALVEFVARS
jgi:protein-S-isoprenylcysteine O-methyltransferase Ste14